MNVLKTTKASTLLGLFADYAKHILNREHFLSQVYVTKLTPWHTQCHWLCATKNFRKDGYTVRSYWYFGPMGTECAVLSRDASRQDVYDIMHNFNRDIPRRNLIIERRPQRLGYKRLFFGA